MPKKPKVGDKVVFHYVTRECDEDGQRIIGSIAATVLAVHKDDSVDLTVHWPKEVLVEHEPSGTAYENRSGYCMLVKQTGIPHEPEQGPCTDMRACWSAS